MNGRVRLSCSSCGKNMGSVQMEHDDRSLSDALKRTLGFTTPDQITSQVCDKCHYGGKNGNNK